MFVVRYPELPTMRRIVSIYAISVSSLITSCFNIAGDCETRVVSRKLNPSKTLQAVYDVTDCGATTTPSSGLRIIENIDPKDQGDRENTVVGSSSGFWYEWKANDTVIVRGVDTTSGYTAKSNYQLKKTSGQIVIIYEK